LIGDFFARAPQRGSSAAPAAVISLLDDAVDGDSPAAVAAREAGAVLAAVAKPPLSAEAAAREAAILGKTKPAAPSKLAQARSVSVNDGGQRKRKASKSKPDEGSEGGDDAAEEILTRHRRERAAWAQALRRRAACRLRHACARPW
jgi:hypothetical protein